MLTIIEHFYHWQIPSIDSPLLVVGKDLPNQKEMPSNLRLIRQWLPNKKAVQVYHQLRALNEQTVYVQSFADNPISGVEPPPFEFVIDCVYISIIDWYTIPLPQAFVLGLHVKSNEKCEYNLAQLFRVSTLNPTVMLPYSQGDKTNGSTAFSAS